MHTFNDGKGDQWGLSLTIGTIKRVRDASGRRFDLLNPSHQVDGRDQFEVFADDLATCWEVVAHIVAPQLEQRGITAEQFGERMAADCLTPMQEALFAEWVDFFRLSQRPDAAAALTLAASGRRKMLAAVAKQVTAAPIEAIETRMEAAINSRAGESFTNLRASLDSILGT